MEISDYAFHSHDYLEKLLQNKLPLKDAHAYLAYPEHRWVFNKIDLYHKQGVPACPHGVRPDLVGISGPLFSKPSTNMLGLSTGTEIFNNYPDDYYLPGYMWMPYLEGEHISVDVFVENGKVLEVFDLVMPSEVDNNGSFMLWSKTKPSKKQIDVAQDFISKNLSNWSGITNIEMIGNVILEIPLRTGTQFIDFYFEKWSRAVKQLTGVLFPDERNPVQNVSYVVRSPLISKTAQTFFSLEKSQKDKIKSIESNLGVNIYLPWKNSSSLLEVNNDGYSVRLAFINAPDKSVALRGWEDLKEIVFPQVRDAELPSA